jgi:hypothetical protein
MNNTAEVLPFPSQPFTISVAGVAPPTTKRGGKEYPVLPDPDKRYAALAARAKLNKELIDVAEGAYKQDKAALEAASLPFWVDSCIGRSDPPSSVAILSDSGEVLLTFQEKFTAAGTTEQVTQLVGPQLVAQYFEQQWDLKIDGSQLPATPATQALVNQVVALFTQAGLGAALQFKSVVKPRKGFNKLRHTLLNRESNLALNRLLPIQAQLKTKGRS